MRLPTALLVLLASVLAHAGEEAMTPRAAADAVMAAVADGDEYALRTLAANHDPDPWFVADELLRRGEGGAALAFARAARRVDTAALPAYVEGHRDSDHDDDSRAALIAVRAALARSDTAAALAVVDGMGTLPDTVGGAYLRYASGKALAAAGRSDASELAFPPCQRPTPPSGSGGLAWPPPLSTTVLREP